MTDRRTERTPPSAAMVLEWQAEEGRRRKKVPRRGSAKPIARHIGFEEYDRLRRAQRREGAQFVGNDPNRLPEVSVMQGQRPLSPEKAVIGDELKK